MYQTKIFRISMFVSSYFFAHNESCYMVCTSGQFQNYVHLRQISWKGFIFNF